MLDYSVPRALGDFGNSFLLAPYHATASALHPEATMFGLGHVGLALWGAFEDHDGVSYCVCREVLGYTSGGCWVMSNADGQGMKLMAGSADLWGGALAIEQAGERIDWRSADVWRGEQRPRLEVRFTPERAAYREGELVDLSATPGDAPGYQFYEPTHGQGVSNHVWNAQGTIAGKAVTGWLGFNGHFQKPGVTYRISPMVRGQMVFWADVGNVYEDGSWEQGPILIGRDGFSAAWITSSDGRSIVANHVEAEFDLHEDGWAREVRCRFVDTATGERQEWSWRPKPGSNMVEQPHMAPYLRNKRSAEGTFTRVGENRVLKHSSAWPDFQVDGRVEALRAEQAARMANRGGHR